MQRVQGWVLGSRREWVPAGSEHSFQRLGREEKRDKGWGSWEVVVFSWEERDQHRRR